MKKVNLDKIVPWDSEKNQEGVPFPKATAENILTAQGKVDKAKVSHWVLSKGQNYKFQDGEIRSKPKARTT